MFKPFTILERGSKLNPNGTGLGLSICKSVLEQLDSKIWIENSRTTEDNKKLIPCGTEVVFTFKLFPQANLKVTSSQRKNKGSKKILVAEDQVIYRETLK